jgi:hypothetical protein
MGRTRDRGRAPTTAQFELYDLSRDLGGPETLRTAVTEVGSGLEPVEVAGE